MKTHRSIAIAAACVVAFVAQGAAAQTAAAAHSLSPAGQGPGVYGSDSGGQSSRTPLEQKAETLMERNMGGLTPAGQSGAKPDHMNKVVAQPRSRASVKAETLAASTGRTLQPAGQAVEPVR